MGVGSRYPPAYVAYVWWAATRPVHGPVAAGRPLRAAPCGGPLGGLFGCFRAATRPTSPHSRYVTKAFHCNSCACPPVSRPRFAPPLSQESASHRATLARPTTLTMDEVRATLQSWNLSQYADVFFEEGYDDLAYLMTLSEEALQRVAESTGMKPGEHT